MKDIPSVKDDYESLDSLIIPDYKYKLAYQGALMHNKFFIFDNQKVFTGSTNISSTCLTGYNSNVAVVINSSQIANYYRKEFEQMYSGKFHNEKVKQEKEPVNIDGMIVFVYFSPSDKITTTKIIPLVQSSQKYIYIPAFYLTHRGLTNALIEAKNRSVDISR